MNEQKERMDQKDGAAGGMLSSIVAATDVLRRCMLSVLKHLYCAFGIFKMGSSSSYIITDTKDTTWL